VHRLVDQLAAFAEFAGGADEHFDRRIASHRIRRYAASAKEGRQPGFLARSIC
jgi:hypothetical protein